MEMQKGRQYIQPMAQYGGMLGGVGMMGMGKTIMRRYFEECRWRVVKDSLNSLIHHVLNGATVESYPWLKEFKEFNSFSIHRQFVKDIPLVQEDVKTEITICRDGFEALTKWNH
eukprot:765719-Hanusia_phi.AAC.1